MAQSVNSGYLIKITLVATLGEALAHQLTRNNCVYNSKHMKMVRQNIWNGMGLLGS